MTENNSSPKETGPNEPQDTSLLNEILESQKENIKHHEEDSKPGQQTPGSSGESHEDPKKPREPISIGTFIKIVGSILFVSIVFLGSFGAYIVFNPEDAEFLIRNLNVDPNDVALLLKRLINWTFGSIIFILSIAWIISMFKAIWTPKDLKRKRLLAWLIAGMMGILLFSVFTFWIYIFSKIQTIDFPNLAGNILIYDNDLYNHEETKGISQLVNGTNVIGPITLRFDIRANAKAIGNEYLVDIESYSINSDGGVCNDGTSIVTGNNVLEEKSIVCTFDQVKTYNIRGTYETISRLGEKKSISMKIDPIEIRGLIDIKQTNNIRGEKIVTLDASNLKKMGDPRWIYQQSNKIVESDTITEVLSEIPQYVCFRIMTENCDRIFILENKDTAEIKGEILSVQDSIEPLLFHLSLSGLSIDPNQLTNIEWQKVDDIGSWTIICKGGSDACEYRSPSYGDQKIQVILETASKKRYTLNSILQVREPLKLLTNMKVLDTNGTLLNTKNTYQSSLKAYVIENTLTPPAEITLDARDISTVNAGYILTNVVWKISNSKGTEEKTGDKVSINLNQPLRYTIEGIYTFQKTNDNTKEITRDIVIIDIERKDLMPNMKISMNSDYTPSIITVDASESESANEEIKKFIFDFGEGKTPTEGDAIQQYEYVTPGEKEISLTIISESGKRSTIKKTIVLKDEAKTISFIPSMTPGLINTPVDFEALGTNGQVEDYSWNFGDNTPTVHGYSTTHSFVGTGTYLVSLTVIYADGTRKVESRKYQVMEN